LRRQEGEDFHRLVQRHLLGIPAERLERHARTPELRRWWQNYRSGIGLEELTEARALHPETSLSAPLGPFRLVAKFDLIAATADGKFIIYDWKTYRKRPSAESLAARLQTRVYRALLAEAGNLLNEGRPIPPARIEMIYWFADFPEGPGRFSYSEGQFARDWAELERLAREISDRKDFPLTDDWSHCRYCPFRSYCDRGARGAPGQAPEDEMDFAQIGLDQMLRDEV
jgi:hypothetical protein